MLKDASSLPMYRKCYWIGHMLIGDSNNVANRQALSYQPQGKRKVGSMGKDQQLEVIFGKNILLLRESQSNGKGPLCWRVLVDALCSPKGNKG